MDVLHFVNLLAEKFGMPTRKKSREQRLADRLLRGASKGALSEARAIIQEGAQVTSNTFGPRLITLGKGNVKAIFSSLLLLNLNIKLDSL